MTKDIKKKPHRDWYWGQRHEMGWSHTHVWQLRIGRDISAAEVPLEERGVPAPYQAPQPRPLVPGKRVPTISVKIAGILLSESEGWWSPIRSSSRAHT